MASASVYYKFKSQKEPSRITFDGTGISVWDLKKEIILQNKMGKAIDFDLGIYNPDTEEGEHLRTNALKRHAPLPVNEGLSVLRFTGVGDAYNLL